MGFHGLHVLTDLLQLALIVALSLLEGDSRAHRPGLSEDLLVELRNSRMSGQDVVGHTEFTFPRICQAEEALTRHKTALQSKSVSCLREFAFWRTLVRRDIIVSLSVSDRSRVLAGT